MPWSLTISTEHVFSTFSPTEKEGKEKEEREEAREESNIVVGHGESEYSGRHRRHRRQLNANIDSKAHFEIEFATTADARHEIVSSLLDWVELVFIEFQISHYLSRRLQRNRNDDLAFPSQSSHELSINRDPSPELMRISALVTRPPKQKMSSELEREEERKVFISHLSRKFFFLRRTSERKVFHFVFLIFISPQIRSTFPQHNFRLSPHLFSFEIVLSRKISTTWIWTISFLFAENPPSALTLKYTKTTTTTRWAIRQRLTIRWTRILISSSTSHLLSSKVTSTIIQIIKHIRNIKTITIRLPINQIKWIMALHIIHLISNNSKLVTINSNINLSCCLNQHSKWSSSQSTSSSSINITLLRALMQWLPTRGLFRRVNLRILWVYRFSWRWLITLWKKNGKLRLRMLWNGKRLCTHETRVWSWLFIVSCVSSNMDHNMCKHLSSG